MAKSYNELSTNQQREVVDQVVTQLLDAILEGVIRFDDVANNDDLQERIDLAIAKAEEMHTPWFAHMYIMDTCLKEIMGMAHATAETTLYPTEEEH